MELKRKTIAKVIAAAFVFNLVVMGAGAWVAYQEAPPSRVRISATARRRSRRTD
jgi:hypothetical protein